MSRNGIEATGLVSIFAGIGRGARSGPRFFCVALISFSAP